MTTLKDKIIEAGLTDHILSDIDLNHLLNGTSAVRYGLVNKAIKKEEIIQIRRGLYLLADRYRQKKLSKFFLASRIVSHSYLSLDSALSYHGWIPEHVTTVTSILARGRTKQFITPFGEFIFYQLPVNEYEFFTGVTRIEEISEEPFLLASPLRALADYVYIKKINWQGMSYLINSLRIEIEQLLQCSPIHFIEIKRVYRSKRVLIFLDNLQKEINKL